MNREVGSTNVERIRIESASDPLLHVAMLRMLGVSKSLHEGFIARHASDVLGRTCAPAGFYDRVQTVWYGGKNCLKDEVVLPAIPEVVLVSHVILRPTEDLIKGRRVLTKSPSAEFTIGWTVKSPAGLELVKMTVGPAHDRLKRIVQAFQPGIGRYQEASPDRWFGSAQSHLEPVHWCSGRSNPHDSSEYA